MKSKIILAVLALTLALTGAARATQERLAMSMKETRLEAGQTRDQLVATLAALTALTKQEKGDLRPAYQAFIKEIPKTEAAAGWTRTRVNWMKADGLQYFEGWQKTVDSISNQSLRKQSQKRLEATKKSYNKTLASFQEAGEKFKPFLTDLNDVQKVLSTDLSASGVKGLRSTVSDANFQFKQVNRKINDALEAMAAMEKSLSTEAK